MLICTVFRTHESGKPKQRGILGPGTNGTISMHSTLNNEMKRYVSCMELREHGRESVPGERPLIPSLHDMKVLTFHSHRGMMVVGFEEINGHRFYQGWLLHWQDH
ncbi:hypothetical protein RBI13_06655 [Alcaligenaceae bacterium A4P071]|nr:hypothetical protein [Alcaligenaceae bacterium B3P038]MDQ2147535.1 hypothetical protein [Alcaligenaceae bacterium C4P045]MDQ2184868.1 hypothetical protein [Alcaligenaceae bacterium A4P071]